jgi:hypothetical protein
MKDAAAEGKQTPSQEQDLEEENKALRAEIERLRRIMAANGLTAAYLLPCNPLSGLDMKSCENKNKCHTHSAIWDDPMASFLEVGSFYCTF